MTGDELLPIALEVATRAGALLRERASLARERVDSKTTATDLVTEVDRAAEVLIVSCLAEVRPGDGVLGEEGGGREGTTGVRWVVDPLDGTTNYVYGYAPYAVSVAAEVQGEVVAGVVFDAVREETFSAVRGKGAWRNGEPIRVSGQEVLGKALLGTGFAYEPTWRARQGRTLAVMLPLIRDIRRSGSAALDLCQVACGRLDGYFELGLNAWDFAAGKLIVEEAGGVTAWVESGVEGRPMLVAGGPAVAEQLVRELQRATGQ